MKTNCITLALTLLCNLALFSHAVEIPDPALQRAIREALGKLEGNITVEDMESMTELNASLDLRFDGDDPELESGGSIKNLSGLEAAVNLIELDLTSGIAIGRDTDFPSLNAEDLSPLGNLSKLTSLELTVGSVSLTLSKGMTSLTVLSVTRGTRLTNMSLPNDLVSLTKLNLRSNRLTSLVVHDAMTSLTELNLGNNPLTNLKLPRGLSSLTTLELSSFPPRQSQLTNLRLPPGLSSLTVLDVTNNPLESLEVPTDLDLENLELRGFSKSDVTLYVPINIERVGNNIEITWLQGVLQSSDFIGGTWSDVDASSPYVAETTGPQQFFRVNPDKVH